MNPFAIKDRLITVLQVFFGNDPDYTYCEDQEQSKIIIADVYGVDRKQAEKYPLITVERGKMGFQRVCIGSREAVLWAAQDGAQTKEVFSNLVSGEATCHCISTQGIESERIAMMVVTFLEMTRHELRKDLKILGVENLRMGKERRLKEWPGQIDTPIMFDYVYPTRWTITDKDILIKKANMKITNK